MKIWIISIMYFQRALIPKRPHRRLGGLRRLHTATDGHEQHQTGSDGVIRS